MKNTFLDYGYTPEEIENKVNDTFYDIFEGPNRFFFDSLNDTSYFMDTGNCDARTEGMSYGMMMCVMMDKKDYFDRMWKFSHDFMYMREGYMKGYFAWSVGPDGKKNAFGPAPDGEEFYAMALFLADKKWGSGEGLYNYKKWAQDILSTVIHHPVPMWTSDNYLIKFVPGSPFSDPSYHLPHFYKYFAMWAKECDRPFWKEAEKASREYLAVSADPKTGMHPEYANFDGTPDHEVHFKGGDPMFDDHGCYFSDAYRTVANIGLDALWNKKTPKLSKIADNLIKFFADVEPEDYMKYEIDGTPTEFKALHPIGMLATLAQGTLACSPSNKKAAEKIIRRFWNTKPRTGERRYYDNCLYMFAMLALSGKYTV